MSIKIIPIELPGRWGGRDDGQVAAECIRPGLEPTPADTVTLPFSVVQKIAAGEAIISIAFRNEDGSAGVRIRREDGITPGSRVAFEEAIEEEFGPEPIDCIHEYNVEHCDMGCGDDHAEAAYVKPKGRALFCPECLSHFVNYAHESHSQIPICPACGTDLAAGAPAADAMVAAALGANADVPVTPEEDEEMEDLITTEQVKERFVRFARLSGISYDGDTNEATRAIRAECNTIAGILIDKNNAYGNSAIDPVRVFSKADTVEQLKVRIDDKLSRIERGDGSGNEDAELDLIGYLILLRVARRLG